MKFLMTLICACLALPGLCQNNNRPLRLAVAGVTHGHLNEVNIRLNRGDFEVVGVYEANDYYRSHNVLAGKLNSSIFYGNLEQMLDATKPEVVVAYGSIYDHLAVVEACAPRHIHVMVEKPLAASVEHAERMAELAKKYGILVLTNYETSWYATNAMAKRLVDEGRLGKVNRIMVYDGHQGPFEIGCSQEFTDWLCDPVLNGGGAVMDFGCYGANLATWLLHGQQPVSVFADLQQRKPDKYPKVDDDATIVVEFPGTTVQIMASWCWPINRKDMYVYGANGYLYQKNARQMDVISGDVTESYAEVPALKAPYDDSFRYLKAVVRGEVKLEPSDLASLENNLTVVRILKAAIESSKTGKRIDF